MSFVRCLVERLPPHQENRAQIEANRKKYGRLGIDVLLEPLYQVAWPPTSLTLFVDQVQGSVASPSLKSWIFYYLFRGFSASDHGLTAAQHFSQEMGLDDSTTSFLNGVYELDHGNQEQALDLVCTPFLDVEEFFELHLWLAGALPPPLRILYLEHTGAHPETVEVYVFGLMSQGRLFDAVGLIRRFERFDLLESVGSFDPEREAKDALGLAFTPREWDVVCAALKKRNNKKVDDALFCRALHVGDVECVLELAKGREALAVAVVDL